MRVELMVSVLQTGALTVSPSVENCARRDFYPRTLSSSTDFVSTAVMFTGGVRRPIRVPILAPFPEHRPRPSGPPSRCRLVGVSIRFIQPRQIDAQQEDFRVPRLNYLHKLTTTEGFAPPYPPVPWNHTARVARLRRTRTVFRASQGGQPLMGLAFLVCHVAKCWSPPLDSNQQPNLYERFALSLC